MSKATPKAKAMPKAMPRAKAMPKATLKPKAKQTPADEQGQGQRAMDTNKDKDKGPDTNKDKAAKGKDICNGSAIWSEQIPMLELTDAPSAAPTHASMAMDMDAPTAACPRQWKWIRPSHGTLAGPHGRTDPRRQGF